MEGLNNYLGFMFTYFSLALCREIFGPTQYDQEYIFYTVWLEKAKKHPDAFWGYLDKNAQQILFDYITNYMKMMR